MAMEVAKNVGGSTIGHTAVGSGGVASGTSGSTSGDSRISQAYNHLFLIWVVRAEGSGSDAQMNLKVNNDTSTLYSATRMAIISSNINSYSQAGQTSFGLSNFTGGGAVANSWGGGNIWMPWYNSTTEAKSMWIENAAENDSTSSNAFRMSQQGWLYDSTSAITQLDFWPYAYDFAEGSTITLYGVT